MYHVVIQNAIITNIYIPINYYFVLSVIDLKCDKTGYTFLMF